MYPVTLSISDVFKGSNSMTVPYAYDSPASTGLLEKLIQFTDPRGHVLLKDTCLRFKMENLVLT